MKGQPSSCLIISFSNFWHKTNFVPSLGSFLPEAFLLGSDRGIGDEDREESRELRPRPRDVILTVRLWLDFDAGDGERDDAEGDEEESRRRLVDLSVLVPTLKCGGGDGEDDGCLFRLWLLVFFACLLLWRELLRVAFLFPTLMLCWRLLWAAGSCRVKR